MMVLAGVTWKLCGPTHEMRGRYEEANAQRVAIILVYITDYGIWVGWYGLKQVDGTIEGCSLFIFYYIILTIQVRQWIYTIFNNLWAT